ncbi:MAG: hypothetical protein ACYDA3_08730 [Gaiellaceae bacterium]
MLTEEIKELLAAPRPADVSPFLERLDATLTAGYAQALQLEAERWRLERRIGEIAAELGQPADGAGVEELASLSQRLTAANEAIASLRALLASLRDRRSQIRLALAS